MPHIYSQLLNAQLENSTGDPASGGTPLGRVYIDITNASNSLPKYFNGTSFVTFGSSIMTPNTTATAAFNTNGNHETIYDTSGSALTTLALTLPTTTTIGQVCRYVSKSGVTTLTLTGTVSIGAALTSMSSNSVATYQAINTTGSFIRLQ